MEASETEDMFENSDKTFPTFASSGNYVGVFPSFTEETVGARASPSRAWDHRDVVRYLWMIGGPVIFVVGVCGNALIVAVMTQSRMRGSSTGVYLTAMAVADSMVLVTGIVPEWLEAAGTVVLKEWHQAACKIEKFLFYTSADTAVWFLVIFTVDRFIAISFPLKKTNFCRSSRAKLSCTVTLVIATLKNVHVVGTRGTQYRIPPANETDVAVEAAAAVLVSNCGKPTAACEYFEDFIRPWIAFAVVSVLPFCIILLCNIFIIAALLRVRQLRTEHSITSTSDRSLLQMTAMCLSASFCFLICVTPSIVLLIGKPYWRDANESAYEIAKVVNNQLVFVNHSVNFFLYCVTGRRFRNAISSVFRCRRRSSFDSTAIEASFESRTTLARLAPSPEQRRMSPADLRSNGRNVLSRSVSLGIANAVFKKTLSNLDAPTTSRDTLPRSRTVQFYESVM